MISLTTAHVTKYKSIDDSTPVDIDDDVTVLVGKNESGKTTFLEALYKSHPLAGEKSKFDVVFDYPRKDYIQYRKKHEAGQYTTVVELTYRIEKDLADRINKELFNGASIIADGKTFTRSTNYANSHTIGFNFDRAAALLALKTPLVDLEHTDSVFANSPKLSDVIAKIEAKELPADSRLAAFAATWRSRMPTESSPWELVEWHVWHTYLAPALPRFLYFDDYRLLEGKINLDTLNARKANPPQLTEADETALGLFDLAGITMPELMSEEGYENSKAKLEAIGLTITAQVFEYWKQNQEPPGTPALAVEFDIKADPNDQPPFNSGKNLYIRIKNLRHGVTVPFDQRSKGFIWFFSFMVWFSAIEERMGTDKSLILLLDEPGLNLHALAQGDLLDYIDTLSDDRQIIYTTHSPFMVESECLDRVRVVEDRAKVGTKVTGELGGSSAESLFPLQAALGYSIAQNLFIAKKNVLIEGPSDLLILQHMSAVLEQEGSRPGLAEGILVPTGGLDKVSTFVALLGANKLDIVVLHDRASTSQQTVENLVRQKMIAPKRVLDYSMFRTPASTEGDMEDLFPEGLYIDAFNTAYAKELKGTNLAAADLGQHPRIVERINQWLTKNGIALLKDGGFNHYRVAQALLPRLTEGNLASEDLDRFGALFSRVNSALS